jgi:hypothetical protein
MSRSYGDPSHYYEAHVDGEDWVVRQGSKPGLYRFKWVSGPHQGYGFTSQSSDGSPMSMAEMDQAIRECLAEIDPETGHISED